MSLVKGTMDGLGKGFGAPSRDITLVESGAPTIEVNVGSQVAFDLDDGQYYMGKTGTTWVKLGSIA